MNALRATVATAVVILTACSTGQIATPSQYESPTATSSPSASPQTSTPSPVATRTPTARLIEVGSLVLSVVEGLSVREEPGLSAARVGTAPLGLRAWVMDGPVEADGYQWFQLTGAPEDARDQSGCLRPSDSDDSACEWIGWAAGRTPTGEAWLDAATIDCPVARDVDAYLSLTAHERLFCAGSDEWQLTVYVPPLVGGRGCAPVWVTEPAWMEQACIFTLPQAVERELDEDSSLQMFTPPSLNTCGRPDYQVCWWAELKGRWVTVTGHLDDPVARTCRSAPGLFADQAEEPIPPPHPALVVHRCRLNFVVSSVIEVVSPG